MDARALALQHDQGMAVDRLDRRQRRATLDRDPRPCQDRNRVADGIPDRRIALRHHILRHHRPGNAA